MVATRGGDGGVRFTCPYGASMLVPCGRRGDGLHPELVRLFARLANGAEANLSETLDASKRCALLRNQASKSSARDRD